ncbi:hypothetical protein ACWJKU_05800 [Methylocaldum sp. MU1018]
MKSLELAEAHAVQLMPRGLARRLCSLGFALGRTSFVPFDKLRANVIFGQLTILRVAAQRFDCEQTPHHYHDPSVFFVTIIAMGPNGRAPLCRRTVS